MKTIPRPEYPRPQMVRKDWMNLNGIWQFEPDYGKSGRERGLPERDILNSEICVPFCPESRLSGIGNTDFMECVWYKRSVILPPNWLLNSRRTILHIGACDYHCEVWVNGVSAGDHTGGYVPFDIDITDYLCEGENHITVCATDELRTSNQPAGKQSKPFASAACYYTRTTGIWQTVWLENVPHTHIKRIKCTPMPEKSSLHIEAVCSNAHSRILHAAATYDGRVVGKTQATVTGKTAILDLPLSELHLWSAGVPNLYNLDLQLDDDSVNSYFGMRDIAYHEGKILINGKPVFQRLVLDQGFYPDGIYTAPGDEELVADIKRSMAMGFNGARLHEKVFEPRFLYHCDRMGYLVWGEYPNWGLDLSKPEAWQGLLPEWLEVLQRDYNHPSIIGWCPLNETQRDQNEWLVRMICSLTREVDPNRLVVDASGWFHVGDSGDIYDTHDYEQDPVVFRERYDELISGKEVPCTYVGTMGTPAFVSEYGGIWWSDTDKGGWGYGNRPASRQEFIERYRGLTEALLDNPKICAFCYTQLTDVEQEMNGLYTFDRKPKFDPALIASINGKPAAIEQEWNL